MSTKDTIRVLERLVEKYTSFVDLSVVTVPDLMLNDIRALLDGAGKEGG